MSAHLSQAGVSGNGVVIEYHVAVLLEGFLQYLGFFGDGQSCMIVDGGDASGIDMQTHGHHVSGNAEIALIGLGKSYQLVEGVALGFFQLQSGKDFDALIVEFEFL